MLERFFGLIFVIVIGGAIGYGAVESIHSEDPSWQGGAMIIVSGFVAFMVYVDARWFQTQKSVKLRPHEKPAWQIAGSISFTISMLAMFFWNLLS